jgi:hypothetical protein
MRREGAVKGQQGDRFIYIVGEQQDGIIPESAEVLAFTKESMQKIETGELSMILANVFAKGQYFPGPEGALTSVIHEFVARSERYQRMRSKMKKGRCTLVTAFKRLDGEIAVKVTAVLPVQPAALSPDQPEGFHALLIASLPDFQNALTEEAYAPDSKLIAIVKEATLHHIQGTLQ